MTRDSVLSFVSQGAFEMIKKISDDGKTEITLLRQSALESDKLQKEQALQQEAWISKWINKPFPHFNMSTLMGKSINSKDLIGKITVINFWFTGCQPCVSEMPQLNKLVTGYDDLMVNFLAFSFNEGPVIQKFLQKHDFRYTQIPQAENLIEGLGINVYPTHMVLDKKGVIREIQLGRADDETLKHLIDNVAIE